MPEQLLPDMPEQLLPDMPEQLLPDMPEQLLPDMPEQLLPDMPEQLLPDMPEQLLYLSFTLRTTNCFSNIPQNCLVWCVCRKKFVCLLFFELGLSICDQS